LASVLFCICVKAQVGNQPDTATQQTDIIDVLKKALNIQSHKTGAQDPKKFNFSVFPAIGYTLQTRLAAIVAGNVAFYSDHNNNNPHSDSNAKLSTITSSLAFTQNSQIVLPLQSDIWTRGDKYNLVGDWRISKYPQDTYGLGGNNSLDSEDLINYSYLRVYQTLLRRFANNFYAGVGYNLDYHWRISEEGYEDGKLSDFAKYGSGDETVSSGVSLDLLYDGRENSINPSGGVYANVVWRNNYKFLGSDDNWQSLLLDVRKYFRFPARSTNILAFWTYDWLVLSGKPPYLDLPSTSWDTYTNTGRGYIQGRFRSRQMLYLESEYRYGITRNGLLGGVVFVNAQSFSEFPGNYHFKYIQPAAGLGLRVKLNKVSKTNIDIDYGFGINNSHGLFINIAEVF
jgi:outer membrane protein assembly factor BamA